MGILKIEKVKGNNYEYYFYLEVINQDMSNYINVLDGNYSNVWITSKCWFETEQGLANVIYFTEKVESVKLEVLNKNTPTFEKYYSYKVDGLEAVKGTGIIKLKVILSQNPLETGGKATRYYKRAHLNTEMTTAPFLCKPMSVDVGSVQLNFFSNIDYKNIFFRLQHRHKKESLLKYLDRGYEKEYYLMSSKFLSNVNFNVNVEEDKEMFENKMYITYRSKHLCKLDPKTDFHKEISERIEILGVKEALRILDKEIERRKKNGK